MPISSTQEKNKAMLMMCACAVLWSIAGIFIKWISWNPLLIAGVRSLIAAIVLGFFMIVTKRSLIICKYSLIAGIGLCFSCTLFVTANKLTTAANSIVLQFTAPIFILLLSSLVFHQKLRKGDAAAVGITTMGIALFFFDQLTPGGIVGNFLAIGAGFFLGLMYTITGRSQDNDSIRMSGLLLAHIFTAIIGIPSVFFIPTAFEPAEVLFVLILGVFQLGIPYIFFGVASRHCPALACSLIGALEPLLNPVWVFLFDGEAPGIFALVGAVIVIAAVTGWCVWDAKKQQIDRLS